MLKKICVQKEMEVAALKPYEAELLAAAQNKQPKNFKKIITAPGLSFICEIKRKSPSKGDLNAINDPLVLLKKYVSGGAVAISVLTDKKFFGGHINDCNNIANKLCGHDIAVLRKEFIIDELQIVEAVAAGADAVLLIVTVLGDKLKRMLDFTRQYNITALVEVHTESEVQQALDSGAKIIGINNRDLNTFTTDINTCVRLKKLIPDHITTIAESAILTTSDIKIVVAAGFDAVLIGEALVTAEDPEQKLSELRAAS